MITLDQARLERVQHVLRERVEQGCARAVSLAVSRGNHPSIAWALGDRDGVNSVTPKTRFLVASLSKPVTAAVLMRLVEEGELTLETPVASILPAFTGAGREEVRVVHLLTHTSGLPDMVAENVELRRRHAPLSEFFRAVSRTELLFRPGTGNSYQSMGFVVMSTLIEHLTGRRFAEFARAELFEPAGMYDTHFGLPDGDDGAEDAQVELPTDQLNTDYHWNSPYWRGLGVPWGGLITTATDLTRFLRLFSQPSVLAPATAQAMTRDWLRGLGPRFSAWGLGFKIKGDAPGYFDGSSSARQGHAKDERASDSSAVKRDSFTSPGAAHNRAFLGELTSKEAYGHSGATGCAMWVDPVNSLSCVLLSSSPGILRDGTLPRIANMVTACAL